MVEFKIEKGIEIPKKKGAGRPDKYPWAAMEVGDSFMVANTKNAPSPPRKQLDAGKVFTRRVVEGGHRVWRVK